MTTNVNNRSDFLYKKIHELNPQRYISVVLPFLAFHPTTALISSIGIGVHRCYILWQAPTSESPLENPWINGATLISIAALGHFYPLTKLALSSTLMLGTHAHQLYHAKGCYKKSVVLFQLTSQAIYVASVYYGTRTLIALSLLIQALQELAQAYQHHQRSQKPEAIASFLLASIRLFKASNYLSDSLKGLFKTSEHKNVEPIEDRIEKLLSKRLSSPELELARLKSHQRIRESLEKISNRWEKLNIAQEIAIAQSIELQEHLKEDYFVINHGQNNTKGIVNILAKKITEIFELKTYKHFLPLRHPLFFQNTQPLEIDRLRHLNPFNDHEYASQILCGDIYLENTIPYESAIHFFKNPATHKVDTKDILQKILHRYISDTEVIQQLTQKLQDLGNSLEGDGTLYSICIPKEKFHQIGWITYVGRKGVPFDKASLKDLDLWQEGKCTFFTDMTCKIQPQVRLLASKLIPEEGVFIIPHSTQALCQAEAQVDEYLKNVQEYRRDVFIMPDITYKQPPIVESSPSEYQTQLHEKIRHLNIDSELFITKSHAENQLSIAKMIQSIALPLSKEPLPPSNQDHESYGRYLKNVYNQTELARWSHGGLHSARVALWTQVLARVYETRAKIENPILLATAGALHDIAREAEGPDYWETQSSHALENLLTQAHIDKTTRHIYTQAIRDKDPEDGFSTDVQRIVHDSDCLEIMRIYGRDRFIKKRLCFYHFNPHQTLPNQIIEWTTWLTSFVGLTNKPKPFYDTLIDEVASFIQLTEQMKTHEYLELHSEDLYGDLIRLLFANSSRFPLITQLLHHDVQAILHTPETATSKHIQSFITRAP